MKSFIISILCSLIRANLLSEQISSARSEDGANAQPKVFLASGDSIRCMESASVLLEYEVWHVDPQESVSVQMFMYHLSAAYDILDPKQILIESGVLPSGELMLSRMKEGKYLIKLELVRKDRYGKEIIASGNSTLGKIHDLHYTLE